jgi:hypothetical protein
MWTKIKHLFPEQAQLPTAYFDNNGVLRILYSHRVDKRSHVGELWVEPENNFKLYSNKPSLITPSEPGLFDSAGVMPSCVYKIRDTYRLWTTGWNCREDVPYGHAIGLMFRNEGEEEWRRYSKGPALDRNVAVPFLANSAFAVEQHNGECALQFCNGTGWDGDFATYKIDFAIADSVYGTWKVHRTDIGYDESANSRPFCEKKSIWFAHKKKDTNYRIAHWTLDMNWEEQSDDVLPRGGTGDFDSDMVCYPWIFEHEGRRYMLYNGNGYGETGIGLAVEE